MFDENTEEYLIIEDLKTSNKPVPQSANEYKKDGFNETYFAGSVFTSMQLLIYAMMAEIAYEKPVKYVRYKVIELAKVPEITVIQFPLPDGWQSQIQVDVAMLVKGIESGIFPRKYYNNEMNWQDIDVQKMDWGNNLYNTQVTYEKL